MCGTPRPASAPSCPKCSFSFGGEDRAPIAERRNDAIDSSRNVTGRTGWLLTGSGVVIALYAATMFDVTAPGSSIINLGRQQDQMLLYIAGVASAATGALLIALGTIIAILQRRKP